MEFNTTLCVIADEIEGLEIIIENRKRLIQSSDFKRITKSK